MTITKKDAVFRLLARCTNYDRLVTEGAPFEVLELADKQVSFAATIALRSGIPAHEVSRLIDMTRTEVPIEHKPEPIVEVPVKHGLAKLTEEQVKEIRAAYESGITKKMLANKYEVAWTTINNIIIGKTWKEVQ